jgi:hypothetical protein
MIWIYANRHNGEGTSGVAQSGTEAKAGGWDGNGKTGEPEDQGWMSLSCNGLDSLVSIVNFGGDNLVGF